MTIRYNRDFNTFMYIPVPKEVMINGISQARTVYRYWLNDELYARNKALDILRNWNDGISNDDLEEIFEVFIRTN